LVKRSQEIREINFPPVAPSRPSLHWTAVKAAENKAGLEAARLRTGDRILGSTSCNQNFPSSGTPSASLKVKIVFRACDYMYRSCTQHFINPGAIFECCLIDF